MVLSTVNEIELLYNAYENFIDNDTLTMTNGYLLYGTTLSTLLTLGINSFQITLDGNIESHNVTRMLKDGLKTDAFSSNYQYAGKRY